MTTTTFDVYVPAGSSSWCLPRSGIVGSLEGGRLLLDYEGARYGQASIRTYADKLHHAAGRHDTRYPTAARVWIDPKDATLVGSYHYDYGRFEPAGGWELVQVAKWLDAYDGDRITIDLAPEFRLSGPAPALRAVEQEYVAASRRGDELAMRRARARFEALQ